jgi:tetratricopeptide (TPR) repeat protein
MKTFSVASTVLLSLTTIIFTAGCSESQSAWWQGMQANNFKSIGEFDKAIACYDEEIKLQPQNAAAYMSRAQAYYGLQRWNRALADYNKAIELDPKSSQYFTERGVTKLQLGLNEQGVADFSQAIALNPKDGNAFYNRAIALDKLGKADLANKDRQEVAKLGYNPEN